MSQLSLPERQPVLDLYNKEVPFELYDTLNEIIRGHKLPVYTHLTYYPNATPPFISTFRLIEGGCIQYYLHPGDGNFRLELSLDNDTLLTARCAPDIDGFVEIPEEALAAFRALYK